MLRKLHDFPEKELVSPHIAAVERTGPLGAAPPDFDVVALGFDDDARGQARHKTAFFERAGEPRDLGVDDELRGGSGKKLAISDRIESTEAVDARAEFNGGHAQTRSARECRD